ncbi:ATP-binding protein [Novosphingobium sp. ZN18A2]|uniref:sensor histidine kinase n=1 Tax=Novosphingobium sp. ZN18A2 TaxID=3079861 RepID=UPI0030D15E8D
MKGSSISWTAVAIAVAATLALLLAGTNAWLATGVLVVWLGTIWLGRPAPEIEYRNIEDGSLSRQAMVDLIESFGLPLMIMDDQRIASANAAAREALGQHIVGQDARVALRHPEAIRLVSERSGRAVVKGLTGPRSIWQVSVVPIDDRFSLVELVNRTAEADISRAHTDFVANASHELRTPLASIIGYIETLADPDAKIDKATAARFHSTVLREAKRLQTLVEDLMSLSRIEAEKHDAPRDDVALDQLVQSIHSSMVANVGEGRLDLQWSGDPIVVRGDRQQLDQLIRNLVDNALKYGDPEKPVTLSVRCERKNAILEVRDRGEGIAADHLPYLTRRFYRTDPGRSRAAGGTGLGLAIVKHIVERHRGTLDIASKVGEGTTVTVSLALKDPEG